MMKKIILFIFKAFLSITPVILSVSCETDISAERYTYHVIYEVTGNSSNSRITVKDADESMHTENNVDLTLVSLWTYTFTKVYNNPFIPLLTVEADLNNAEYVTLSIFWEDYNTDFTREELASKTYTNNSGGFLVHTVEVTSPPLP